MRLSSCLAMENFYFYIAFFLSAVVFIIKLLSHCHHPNSPPSPFSLPIIGHVHLLKPTLYKALETLSLQYGPILSLKFGSLSFVVISSPSAVEERFTKNDIVFANRPRTMAGEHLTYNLTDPVWAPDGDMWRNLRRFASIEIFSQMSLQKFSTIRREEVDSLLRRLFKASNKKPEIVELRHLVLTFDVQHRDDDGHWRACVGEEAASTDMGKQHLEELKQIYFADLTLSMCDFFPILRWLGYKGLEKGMISLQVKRDESLRRLIEENKQKKATSFNNSTLIDGEKKRTLLETLLSLSQSEPEFYSDDVIKSLILKVREEIDNEVGHGHLINESDLAKLPYLRCVMNETLRLYPIVPLLLPHYSTEDCTVGGFQMPRGTFGSKNFRVNAWGTHRDPKLWEDSTRFKPERFEAASVERDGFKFLPFGIGRGSCPGAGMGQRIILLTLYALIQCFDWEIVGKGMVDMNPGKGFLLSKAKPLQAVCRPRLLMTNIPSHL
ncbi:Isoflavone 2'-hydroxylase [Morella rubra]|uniref:Isoflavone 2'-hydroxylase n=1 Tax=Morella rubra TaxID=262757 RepID=A0A6A1W8B3_9ROSI|nr:Isoflavone 2'-hydroxylase [Morella rubra]